MTTILFNAKEMYEDEEIAYAPINALKFQWWLNKKNMPEYLKLLKEDYDKDQDKNDISGLIVYKKGGGWCWCM